MSERNRMRRLDLFVQVHGKSDWRFLLNIVISNKATDNSVVIVSEYFFHIFIWNFYSVNHPLCFLKGKQFLDQWSNHNLVRKENSLWRFFLSDILKFLTQKSQTNSCYQLYTVQNAHNRCVLFHVLTEHNRDLCGCVTELCGLCGR